MATDSHQSISTASPGKRIGLFVIAYNAVNKLDWTLDRIPKEVWDKVDEVFLLTTALQTIHITQPSVTRASREFKS